ncbi:MAG: hypothetical protein CVV49_00645 [Spirochaetae bacterium HGW-Spirochaetae-5]|nr:MAG: hypothetical protein CVV49_00645 [Spirochaetae bacterium HGW-Spirochaetae-5]
MTDTKKKGRPHKEGGAVKAYSIRIDESLTKRLDEIAAEEREKTGYNVDRSAIIRRACIEFIQRYDED